MKTTPEETRKVIEAYYAQESLVFNNDHQAVALEIDRLREQSVQEALVDATRQHAEEVVAAVDKNQADWQRRVEALKVKLRAELQEAVAAEREKWELYDAQQKERFHQAITDFRDVNKSDAARASAAIKAERERHASELASIQTDMQESNQRYKAEMQSLSDENARLQEAVLKEKVDWVVLSDKLAKEAKSAAYEEAAKRNDSVAEACRNKGDDLSALHLDSASKLIRQLITVKKDEAAPSYPRFPECDCGTKEAAEACVPTGNNGRRFVSPVWRFDVGQF